MLHQQRLPSLVSKIRNYSQKKSDPVSLADALGLLSPAKNVKSAYKPSLFKHLQKGSVAEQYNEIKQELSSDFTLPNTDHRKQFGSILADLNSVASLSQHKLPTKNLLSHVKSLQNEDELIELAQLSYVQQTLSLQVLMQVLFNRNLRDLSRLPFDIDNIDEGVLDGNGWSKANYAQLKILLLKKYHDLGKPLDIIKLLRDNYDSVFLPLIKQQSLSAFYERIVWRFYFEYIGLGKETQTIAELDNIRSSFLIWEASTVNNLVVLEKMMKQHKLNFLQDFFLQFASSKPVQNDINMHGQGGAGSSLLSALKKTSIKFKLYEVEPGNTVVSRATAYSLIHRIEGIIMAHFPTWRDDAFLSAFMEKLNGKRTEMIHGAEVEAELGESTVFVH